MIINNKYHSCLLSQELSEGYSISKYSNKDVLYSIYRLIANQRLFYLEEQRDFFRAQVIKLNEDLKKLGEEHTKAKSELSQTRNQCDNYRKIVYDLQTRIYKLTYENIQIEKMKQQGKNNLPATLHSTITPSKGFITDREPKDRYRSDKVSEKANAEAQSQLQQNAQKVLNRQKTHYSLRKLKPSNSLGATSPNLQLFNRSPDASSREEILDRCIKQLKKEIYYRNLNAKEANKITFDEQYKVSFEKFTKSDRKQLVYRFMSNPQILQDFYKFVFLKARKNKDLETSTLDKIALAKGMDSRYNTKMLDSFKAQFDKRIYDIKANRY